MPRLFAVSDLHGHRSELVAALAAAELIDEDANWAGGEDELWFLGDYVDRGPDGIGVIDLIRELQQQTGTVHALLGNHEILALGMLDFDGRSIRMPNDSTPNASRSFELSWLRNGGKASDQERLNGERRDWLTALPYAALVGDNLLLHSDTLTYLQWGSDADAPTIAEINAAGREMLGSDDPEVRFEQWRQMTARYDFRGEDGPANARTMLAALGGRRIVHGHSIVSTLRDDLEAADIREPYSYADGLALGIDGGIYAGGRCLLVDLSESDAEG